MRGCGYLVYGGSRTHPTFEDSNTWRLRPNGPSQGSRDIRARHKRNDTAAINVLKLERERLSQEAQVI